MNIRKQTIYMAEKPERIGEVNIGPVITDQIHIPMNDLIRDFIDNGKRLEASRAEYYHDTTGDDMEEYVPIDPGADPTEADSYVDEVQQILEEKKAAINADRASKAAEIARQSAETLNTSGNTPASPVADIQAGTGPLGNKTGAQ